MARSLLTLWRHRGPFRHIALYVELRKESDAQSIRTFARDVTVYRRDKGSSVTRCGGEEADGAYAASKLQAIRSPLKEQM